METLRKVLAAIIGLIIIIAVILLAKWVGDQVRLRFFTPKTVSNTQITTPANNQVPAKQTETTSQSQTGTQTTLPATTPATGPNDWIYVAVAFLFISGLAIVKFTPLDNR